MQSILWNKYFSKKVVNIQQVDYICTMIKILKEIWLGIIIAESNRDKCQFGKF